MRLKLRCPHCDLGHYSPGLLSSIPQPKTLHSSKGSGQRSCGHLWPVKQDSSPARSERNEVYKAGEQEKVSAPLCTPFSMGKWRPLSNSPSPSATGMEDYKKERDHQFHPFPKFLCSQTGRRWINVVVSNGNTFCSYLLIQALSLTIACTLSQPNPGHIHTPVNQLVTLVHSFAETQMTT